MGHCYMKLISVLLSGNYHGGDCSITIQPYIKIHVIHFSEFNPGRKQKCSCLDSFFYNAVRTVIPSFFIFFFPSGCQETQIDVLQFILVPGIVTLPLLHIGSNLIFSLLFLTFLEHMRDLKPW